MKERPILFSAPMVRAILEGRKTQTRRIVKFNGEQPPAWATFAQEHTQMNVKQEWCRSHLFGWSEEQTPGEPLKSLRRWPNGKLYPKQKEVNPVWDWFAIPCPFGKPGDRLWVRETWRSGGVFDGKPPRTIAQSCLDAGYPRPGAPVWYEEDQSYRRWGDNDLRDFDGMGEKRVAIFMPRWASRLTLEITEVRVQRLQEISAEDALAEGVDCSPITAEDVKDLGDTPEAKLALLLLDHGPSPRFAFQMLWSDINGADSWDANPWVWALTFSAASPDTARR